MENLPKDIQRKIALELKPYDLIEFCLVDKKTKSYICDSDEFWRLKLSKDYPEIFTYYQENNLILKNPRATYIRKFTEITKEIEDFLLKNDIRDKTAAKEMWDIFKLYQDWKASPGPKNDKFSLYKQSLDTFLRKYGKEDQRVRIVEIFDKIERKNLIYLRK